MLPTDISDTERPNKSTPPPTSNAELDSRQQALNYSTLAAAAAANVPNGGQDSSLSSTETLLRNIQGLLKVAADNARQQERQISFEKGKRRFYFCAARNSQRLLIRQTKRKSEAKVDKRWREEEKRPADNNKTLKANKQKTNKIPFRFNRISI